MKHIGTLSPWSVCLAALFLLQVACDRGPKPAPEAETQVAGPVKVEGGSFNKFFPDDADGFDRAFTAEKEGFAQATLDKDGTTMATITVSDLTGNSSALKKYEKSSSQIAGFPSVSVGSKGTAVLVGDFQVQVRSKSDGFTASDREAWLNRFDLSGLSKLAK